MRQRRDSEEGRGRNGNRRYQSCARKRHPTRTSAAAVRGLRNPRQVSRKASGPHDPVDELSMIPKLAPNERSSIETRRYWLPQRRERARHHVHRAARTRRNGTIDEQRHEHVLAMQCTMRADVWDRLMTGTEIPIAGCGENDLSRPR